MTLPPLALSAATLGVLATAAERGLLVAPFGSVQIRRLVSSTDQLLVQTLLDSLHKSGLQGTSLAAALRLAESARLAGEHRPQPALVWSDFDMTGSRDTGVVCDELFRNAERSVLVSTYNFGHWTKPGDDKGNPVLLPLAERMASLPSLNVRLFVNVRRLDNQSTASAAQIEKIFLDWFRREIWPWNPVPELYYDPRSIAATGEDTACLHAKCVAIDDARAFVTSANLTEAAHERNIELGVLLHDPVFAKSLRVQFDSLIGFGRVRRII